MSSNTKHKCQKLVFFLAPLIVTHGLGTPLSTQSSEHKLTIMHPNQVTNSQPSEGGECRGNVLASTHSSHKSRGKVDGFLDTVDMSLGCSAPCGKAVKDMRKDVGLNKDLEDVFSEVVTKFVQ